MKPSTPLLILNDLNEKFKLNPTGQATFAKAKEARAKIQSAGMSLSAQNLPPSTVSKQGISGESPTPDKFDASKAYEPGTIKDEVEWGAKFAEPDEEILNSLVAPTKSGEVNSPTEYRDVPAGTKSFNKSQKTGQQINFGADFAAQAGEELINPFAGEAKVVKGLGLSGSGNSVSLEYTLPSGKTVYADLNHNQSNLVKVGETVKPGQAVAKAGQTGNANGVHSDFSVYSLDKNRSPIYFDTSKKFN